MLATGDTRDGMDIDLVGERVEVVLIKIQRREA